MTIDEAKNAANELTKINLSIWKVHDPIAKNNLANEFRSLWKEITMSGYKIVRRRIFNSFLGFKVPDYKIREDHSEQCVSIVDNRSKDGYHKGDCTTRCISFCTGVDYDTIQREQFAYAKQYNAYGVTWRTPKIWSRSLTSRGYCHIGLPRRITGKVFLRLFKDCGIDEGRIAALSSHHVAAIDMKEKKILDIWNSAGCRIQSLFVPVAQKELWQNKIRAILG